MVQIEERMAGQAAILAVSGDITMGGGEATFAEKATAGRFKNFSLAQQAEMRGYQVVKTADKLAAVQKADQKQPVLGLLAAVLT